jgi:FlaA1/EpsC-like NDP-sugar epimerase
MTLATCAALRLGPEDVVPWRVAMLLPVVWGVQYLAGAHFGLYRGRWVFGSIEEVAALGRSVFVAGATLFLVDAAFLRNRPLPLSAVVAGTMMAFLLMGAVRYWWRIEHDRSLRPTLAGRTRVIVFGAGDGGQRAVRAMLRDPESTFVPVAMLDDDPKLRGLRFMGLRVVGDRSDIVEVARRFDARAMVVAVPSLTGPQLRELVELASAAQLDARVLPSVRELLDGEVRVVDIRQPDERDLLGRHHIETDLDAVAAYLRGKRVLVTGAGGSIGSELCRQIAAFQPGELLMVDRDESALHAVQLSISGRALLDTPDLVLLDIRDRARVRRLFEERRPEIVFHAAALKHLPLLETHPAEALKTNVWGSLAVLEAAADAGVECFVNISTDKAANPCSVLGFSKRIAEGLTASLHERADGRYLSVRFGNVLGSRGSVLHAFRRQIESGGPLTVTHPDASRFFMTVEEAVQLVLQAAAIGNGGEVMVLDMGAPVSIAEVARRLATTVDPPCPIEFVGLRPGEKLHEELFGENELAVPSAHPLISQVEVPPIRGDDVRNLDPTVSSCELVETLSELCMSMAIDLLPAALERWDTAVGGD